MSLVVGIDVGTSGVRAAACDAEGRAAALASAALPAPSRDESGRVEQDPRLWWTATEAALDGLFAEIDPGEIEAIAVDGTSGTVLAIAADGTPLGPARLYNDAGAREAAARIREVAPSSSGAHGATSGLAKAIELAALGPVRILHQADWIAAKLSGRFDVSDENNALKTGYDPVARTWAPWLGLAGLDARLLPRVVEPGTPIGIVTAEAARRFRLGHRTLVAAGTTDGCASFLATGADAPGDAVTALGSTLTLKILSPRPIFAPEHGIYSHRLGAVWLAGGASNSGGAVIAAHFSAEALARLEPLLDPASPTGLDYYPLLRPGERFPLADPHLAPRLTPRPAEDARFLQAMLEGIARIEAQGYERLAALGAPKPRRVLSVGGGARNAAWTAIRQGLLGLPLERAPSDDAAVGTARLARLAVSRSHASA